VRPYGPLSLWPCAQVLHYGQEVFEGLKAYRTAEGTVHLFRPWDNARRFAASCRRMCMPELPPEAFVAAVRELTAIDRNWVPTGEGTSLYLRPFMIATQPSLGFRRPAQAYLFCVIACPAGAYFGGGDTGLTVWVEREYTRAAPGGTGEAKCGGNYAATLLPFERAMARGCDQIVWLDAGERRWLSEMGTSNVFFVIGERLVTPRLSGTVLHGVTRASVLRIARDLGIETAEEAIDVDELIAGIEDGSVREAFASGTTALISPIGALKDATGHHALGCSGEGPVTRAVRERLTAIQYGRHADEHGWLLQLT
jgi:branched-chain amino acid aminotransferase